MPGRGSLDWVQFELSAHEVMRGIKVRDDELVLRPSGLVLTGTGLDIVVGAGLAVLAIVQGALWWLAGAYGAVVLVDGAARLRVAVVASQSTLTIRNRWRTRVVPLAGVHGVGVSEHEWLLRRPFYFGVGSSPFSMYWEMGFASAPGGRISCDALISAPQNDQADPTPARMKIATLQRWIDAVEPTP